MYIPKSLSIRDDSGSDSKMPATTGLLIALLVLVIVGVFAIIGLFVLRRIRRSKAQDSELPAYTKKHTRTWHNHGLTITTSLFRHKQDTSSSAQEKELMSDSAPNSPTSPLPEIRITFPEEVDEKGQTMSGKVVVVRVGDTGVGLEPVQDETLPPYEKTEGGKFQSIDLERVGGLKEKTWA